MNAVVNLSMEMSATTKADECLLRDGNKICAGIEFLIILRSSLEESTPGLNIFICVQKWESSVKVKLL